VLFPTLSALNSPPTATGECLPLCPPTPPSPLKLQRPQTLRRPRSVSHSVAPRQATLPLLGPSRTRSGSRRRRTVDALLGAAILRCCLRCGPSRTSLATSPLHNSPSPPLSPSLSLLSRSSLSSLFRVVADAVAVALVAEVAAVVPVAAAVLDRELRPQPHLRTARSNRGPRLRTQTSPPTVAVVAVLVLAVAVVVVVRVAEAADAVPAADAVAAGPRPVLSPSPSLLRSPSLPRSRNTLSAR